MKTIITILFTFIFITSIFASEIFLVPSSVKLNQSDILIKDGPTLNLQNEINGNECATELNLGEELETELIGIRAIEICT